MTLRLLTQKEALILLKKYKINYVNSGSVKNPEEGIKLANKLGYPVVVKIDSESIIHKSEMKAVVTNITDTNKLRQTINEMQNMLNSKNIKNYTFLIQKQIKGVEIVVGSKKDSQFGQMIMAGLGGIFVELYKDVSFRIAPINKNESLKMLQETKAIRLLEGFRGDNKKATDKLGIIIENTSKLIFNEPQITELDFNPVMVDEKDAIVVDARIMVEE